MRSKIARRSGVLLHPSSFPGPWGIGDLGAEAYKFVDFLQETHQQLWQVLPLGPTGEDGSPYSSFSASAGNPLFISLEALAEEGLKTSAAASQKSAAAGPVDQRRVRATKLPALKRVWQDFKKTGVLRGGLRALLRGRRRLAGRLRPVHGPQRDLSRQDLEPVARAISPNGSPRPWNRPAATSTTSLASTSSRSSPSTASGHG